MKFKINGIEVDSESASFQKDVDSAVEKTVKEATTTLTTKNTELLGELKTAKKAITPADEIERLKKVETDYEALKDDKMKGNSDYEKLLNTSKEQHGTELAGKDEIIASLNGQLNTTLVSDALTKALVSVKVNEGLMGAARTMLASQVSVIDQDGKKVALVGDKTIQQHVEDWAKSDEGKHFVLADQNGGGGSGGSGGGGGGGTDNDKYFDPNNAEFNTTKQAEVYTKEGAPEYERLAEKFKDVVKK